MHTASTIDVDLPCVTCGYNLRTRGVDSICPECGDEVWKSLPNDNFVFQTSRDASRFRAAMAWILLFIILEALFVIQLQVAMWNWHSLSRSAQAYSLRIRWDGHASIRFLVVIAAIAAWRSLRGETARKARRAAAVLVVLSMTAALSLAAVFYCFDGRAWSLFRPVHMFPEDALYVISGASWLATWCVVMALVIRVQVRPQHVRAMYIIGATCALLITFPELSNAISMALDDEFGDNFEWPATLRGWVSTSYPWDFKATIAAWSIWLLAFWYQLRRLAAA